MNTFKTLRVPRSQDQIIEIWCKGQPIPGYDLAQWRRDYAGRPMRFADYGKRNSKYGWEKGHIVATVLGGNDHISNMRPENWLTNAREGGLLS